MWLQADDGELPLLKWSYTDGEAFDPGNPNDVETLAVFASCELLIGRPTPCLRCWRRGDVDRQLGGAVDKVECRIMIYSSIRGSSPIAHSRHKRASAGMRYLSITRRSDLQSVAVAFGWLAVHSSSTGHSGVAGVQQCSDGCGRSGLGAWSGGHRYRQTGCRHCARHGTTCRFNDGCVWGHDQYSRL